MDYSIILPILLGVFIFFGFVFGFFRGTKKTLTRFLLLALIAFLTGICSIKFIPYVLEFDLSRFKVDLGGATNLKEFAFGFLNNALNEAQMTITDAQLESLTEFVVGLASMLISGVLFLVLFILFKILSMPIFWIINSVLSEVGKGRKKRRFIGALVGVVLGFFLFSVVTLPLTGYLNVANSVNVATTTETQKGLISSNKMIEDIVYDAYLDNGVYGFMDKIGIAKLQKNIFEKMTTVKFNDETVTVSLDSEAQAIAKLYMDVMPLVEKAQSGETLSEGDRESITTAVKSLTDVKIFKALRQSTAIKGFSGIASNAANTAISSSGVAINVEPIINDVFDFLTVSDDTTFANGINSVVALTFGIMSLTANGGFETLDFDAFENLGASFDSVISNDIIKLSTLKTFTIELLDSYKTTIEESVMEGVNVTTCLDAIKDSIQKAESLQFKHELKAIGKVYDGVMGVIPKDGEEFSLDADGIIELGVILDDACNCGSALINPELLNVLTAEILKGSNLKDTDFISVVFDDLVSKFENKEILNFANEFRAVAIIYGEVTGFINGDVEELSKEQIQGFGKSLDEAIASDSKLVNSTIVNKLCAELIGGLELGTDLLYVAIEDITTKLKNNEVKAFTPEFNAIAELIGLTEEFENVENVEDLSLDKIGTTIDTIISYNSVLLDNKTIDNILVPAVKTAFDITKEEEELPDEDKEPIVKAILKLVKPLEEHKIVADKDNPKPYTREFTAINDLLGIVEDLSGGELNQESAENMGNNIDVALSHGSECVQREIINDLIVDSVDEFFNEDEDSTLNGAIDEIKKGFGGFKEGPYVNEFKAIAIILDEENSNKLQDGIDDLDGAIAVGELLDDIVACEGKVITRKVVNTLIVDNLDAYMGDANDGGFDGAIEKISDGFKNFNEGLYVTEFSAIGKLLDKQDSLQGGLEDSSSATEIGVVLDEIVESGAKVINREVINIVIVDNIDSSMGIEEGEVNTFKRATSQIKSGFESFGGAYVKEFTAIGIMLEEETNLKGGISDSPSAKHLGDVLDDIVECKGEVITRDVLNLVIVDNLDAYMSESEGAGLKKALGEIKTGFENFKSGLYIVEFTAIGKLLDEKEGATIESRDDAKEIGATFDSTLKPSTNEEECPKVITYKVVNIFIAEALNSYTSGFGASGYSDAINDVKLRYKNNLVTENYTNEFDAIGVLVDIENDNESKITAEKAVDVGESFDEIKTLGAKSVDYIILDKLIVSIIGDTFGALNEDDIYYGIVSDIKYAFGTGHPVHESVDKSSYKNEFTAIGELMKIQNVVDTENGIVESGLLKGVGKQLDDATGISNVKSVKVETINLMICRIVDNNFNDEEGGEPGKFTKKNIEGESVIDCIKKPFNKTTGVEQVCSGGYEREFSAIGELLEIKDNLNESSFGNEKNAKAIGAKIDESLRFGALSITKDLIDNYIKNVIDDNSIVSIKASGDFKDSKEKIKANLEHVRSKKNGYKYTYESEFGYIAKLSTISSDYSNIEVGKDNSELGTKLNGIAMSCLVGDCGMYAIISSFKSYEANEINDKAFRSIEEEKYFKEMFSQINDNLEIIASKGKFGINYDDGEEKYTYLGVINAIKDVYDSMTKDDTKIIGNTNYEKTYDNLETYQEKLETLEKNIVVYFNGARAIARYLVFEIDLILENKIDVVFKDNLILKEELKTKVANHTKNYVDYYTGNLDTDSADYKKPDYYNIPVDKEVKENNYWYPNVSSGVRVNKPFEAIFDYFLSLVPISN